MDGCLLQVCSQPEIAGVVNDRWAYTEVGLVVATITTPATSSCSDQDALFCPGIASDC